MAADLCPFSARIRPGGPVLTYSIPAADAHVARRLYRWQSLNAKTGERYALDDPAGQSRRRLARSHASLFAAVRHEGYPPTEGLAALAIPPAPR